MAMKQPIDGTVIDGMPYTFFKRAPDQPHRRDLPALGLCEKRSEEVLLFFERQILPPPSLTFRFNRCDAETSVSGDHRMNTELWTRHSAEQSLKLLVAQPERCRS